jgi:hypothetical protein
LINYVDCDYSDEAGNEQSSSSALTGETVNVDFVSPRVQSNIPNVENYSPVNYTIVTFHFTASNDLRSPLTLANIMVSFSIVDKIATRFHVDME